MAASESRHSVADGGSVALVIRQGHVLVDSVSGPSDAAAHLPVAQTTRFQISSVSKQWLATIFGLLHERGRVNWADRVDRWFPELPYAREISVHQLLTHTSGLGHWDDVNGVEAFAVLSDEERLDALARSPLHTRPGTSWSYSGLGYVLLGQIASRLEQLPYSQLVEHEIINKLGLVNTTCGRPSAPDAQVALGDRGRDASPLRALANLPGTGDVWSTASDLAEFARAFQEGRLTSPATVQTLLESSVDMGEHGFSDEWMSTSRYAYGRYLGTLAGHPAWWHPGDNPGFQSFLGHLPEAQTTVVVLSNAPELAITAAVEESLRDAGLLP